MVSLDDYMNSLVQTMRGRNYSDDDIKSSLDNILISHSYRTIFLIMLFIYTLFAGILIAASAIMVGYVMQPDALFYSIICLIFLGLGYMIYFGFRFLDFKNGLILVITLSTSVIISMLLYAIHAEVEGRFSAMTPMISQLPSSVSIFNLQGANIYIIIGIVIFAYNILPIIFMIKGD